MLNLRRARRERVFFQSPFLTGRVTGDPFHKPGDGPELMNFLIWMEIYCLRREVPR